MSKWFLKIRSNVNLEGDLQLAEREIKHLFNDNTPITIENIDELNGVCPKYAQTSNSRNKGIIGYLVSNPFVDIDRIVTLLSFIQEIWQVKEFASKKKPYAVENGNFVCIVPFMALAELLFYSPKVDEDSISKLLFALAYGKEDVKPIKRANTSAPHIHSFHIYKAKFFPRFVRSLLVSNINIHQQEVKVCDPFVGSGTTLIEGSLMGFDSCGIDIDPLSCFISETKSQALDTSPKFLQYPVHEGLFSTFNSGIKYEFPDVIRKKFQRWNSMNEMNEYEEQISAELSKIDAETGYFKSLHKIALSDALTKKFNIRMMGTGSGRFALEIAKTDLTSLIKNNIASEIKSIEIIHKLKEMYQIYTPAPYVVRGSATEREFKDNYFDIIITSPPYIPASSGREDYLVGKLISLKAMGLYTEEDVNFCSQNSVGSMNSKDDYGFRGLPQSVIDLYNWLIHDDLRSIKAKPILAYYQSIKKSLLEDFRTIKKQGKVIYIIGKETIFYNSATKDILYRVKCDSIFKEIANNIGFSIDEVIDIELDKKNKVARPRGSDKYYECAIIMSRNEKV